MLDKNNEVLFGEYCKTCKYERYSETDSPCAECLAEPVNLYSHKPVKWEGADGIYAGPPPRPDHAYQRAVKYVPENRKDREKAIARHNIDAEYTGNKVQTIDDKVTDDQYPSATAVKKVLDGANEVTAQSLAKKIDAPDTCERGEFLAVEEVNEDGVVTKVKGAKVQTDPPDWSENDPTKPGYVKNRPGGYMVKQAKKTTVTVTADGHNDYDFAAFPPFEVGDTVNIMINGTEYSLVARIPDGVPDKLKVALIGDDPNVETHEFGWSFFRVYMDSDNERISFVNFTDADMTVQWDSGEEDVPVKFDPKYMPEIDPKTIPDMYYTEKITDITGYSTKLSVMAEETTHDEIPFELGQTWESTNYSYGVMEVKQAIDGTLYIGDYPAMGSIPYYITRTTIKGLSQWISMMRPSEIEIVCTICGEVSKTIPDKYLPSNLFTQDNAPVKFGIGSQSAVQGGGTASGNGSHAEGGGTASGNGSHAEGGGTASGNRSHAEGYETNAGGYYTHAEGYSTETSGWYSHAEGYDTVASAQGAHAEGHQTTASGQYSHAEGHQTTASGQYSHAEGDDTVASAQGAHAEGHQTTASGQYSHAEGRGTVANRYNMTASGCYNSYEDAAFIEKSVKGTTISISSSDIYYGSSSYTFDKSKGRFSLVNPERLSFSTIKSSQYVTKNDSFSTDMYYLVAIKKSTNTRKTFNATRFYRADASKTVGNYIHVVGNGNSSKRSNAYTLDWDGNGCFAGDVYVGGISKDTGAKKLITADEVYNSLILPSSTPDSTKKFKISVDDNGTISATEVTI